MALFKAEMERLSTTKDFLPHKSATQAPKIAAAPPFTALPASPKPPSFAAPVPSKDPKEISVRKLRDLLPQSICSIKPVAETARAFLASPDQLEDSEELAPDIRKTNRDAQIGKSQLGWEAKCKKMFLRHANETELEEPAAKRTKKSRGRKEKVDLSKYSG